MKIFYDYFKFYYYKCKKRLFKPLLSTVKFECKLLKNISVKSKGRKGFSVLNRVENLAIKSKNISYVHVT